MDFVPLPSPARTGPVDQAPSKLMSWHRIRKIEARSREHVAIVQKWDDYFAVDLEPPKPPC